MQITYGVSLPNHASAKPQSEFMTAAELMEKFGVTKMTIYRWLKAGAIPKPVRICHNVRGKLYWKRAEIEAMIKERTV